MEPTRLNVHRGMPEKAYRVLFRNTGSSPVIVAFTERRLSFASYAVSPSRLEIPPGGEGTASVQVSGLHPFLGRDELFVRVLDGDGRPLKRMPLDVLLVTRLP